MTGAVGRTREKPWRERGMDAVLKQLEGKLEELIAAYGRAVQREAELRQRVEELESQLADTADLPDKIAEYEKQRGDLAARLEKVLALVNSTLESTG